jgi:hypothetical protein
MKMNDFLNYKKWFKKNEPPIEFTQLCDKHHYIIDLGKTLDEEVFVPKNFVMGNKTCLIIDDNYGQVNILSDDIEYIFNKYNITDINLLKIQTNMGAFEVNDLLLKYGRDLRIDYAIVDLTIGGSRRIGTENIKLTGVDVVGFLKNYSEDLKIIIYTGNNLNTYIESNVKIMNKFKSLTGYNINDHIIIKRSLTVEERREAIAERLFNKKEY